MLARVFLVVSRSFLVSVSSLVVFSSLSLVGLLVLRNVGLKLLLACTTLCESIAKIKIKRASHPQTFVLQKCFYNHQK